MPPKRQHYVPRLHLKHFVGTKPKGQIWTYDKETGEKRSGKPENTAVETHFYSVENDDGTMDTWLEDCLAKVEDKAGPIYKHLVAGHLPTSDQEKADFSTFVALMYLRTPAVRRDAAEIIGRDIQIMSYAYGSDDRAFADLVERFEREGRTLDDAAKHRLREVLIDPSRYTLKIPKARTFMALGAADKLADLLFGMNWSLVRPNHGFFITSDHPVVRWVDPKTRHPFYGDHGFLDKTVEVTFPLAPKMLLMMAWQTMRKTAELRRDSVWSTNKMRASRADRYIYAHIGSKELRQLAVSFKGSRPGHYGRIWPEEVCESEGRETAVQTEKGLRSAGVMSLRRAAIGTRPDKWVPRRILGRSFPPAAGDGSWWRSSRASITSATRRRRSTSL